MKKRRSLNTLAGPLVFLLVLGMLTPVIPFKHTTDALAQGTDVLILDGGTATA